jgi:hypothetical protein
VVDRRGDVLLVVPVLPPSAADRVREIVGLCSRADPTGSARLDALRALIDLHPAADLPGFALLVRAGSSLRSLVHGPVRVLVDGARLDEQVLADGAWHELTVAADRDAVLPAVPAGLQLDLERGTVPGAGVTLLSVPAGPAPQLPGGSAGAAAPGVPTSTTALRPAVQFRTVLLGECAVTSPARRPPLPVAGARGAGAAGTATTGPEVLVEGVHCPQGHFTDPELPTCPTCGAPLPDGGPRVRLPRPPLGILVTDGGTIYPVTGDLLIGREAAQAPEVLAGRARALPLRDAARSTSRVHARLTVTGWKVLLVDNGSANGTFLSRSGAAGPWLPVTARIPVALVHGDRVRLGKRQLLFDTWRDPAVPRGPR